MAAFILLAAAVALFLVLGFFAWRQERRLRSKPGHRKRLPLKRLK